jgi:hypothetical protein
MASVGMAIATAALAVPASAAGGVTPPQAQLDPIIPNPAPTRVVPEWTGGTIALDAHGRPGEIVSGEWEFMGQFVAVPGDRVHRTAQVTNSGPTPAHLTVSLVHLTAATTERTVNHEFEDLIEVFWDIDGQTGRTTVSEARQRDPFEVVTVWADQGEAVAVTVGWEFPFDATGGRADGGDSIVLSFDIDITLRGTVESPPASPSPDTSGAPESAAPGIEPSAPTSNLPPPAGAADRPGLGGHLSITGAQVHGLMVVGALALLAAGLWFLIWGRSRRDSEPGPDQAVVGAGPDDAPDAQPASP